MTKKYQLKNGLKVIFQQSHKSPVVSIQAWVRTGSADEQKGEEGISHFIEHLVFKGTAEFKVGEIASLVEGCGGELNAYTSFDQTVFYVTISKNYFDQGLKVISEMMGHPLFDPQEIDNEREVVIEEIKRGQDSIGRRASQLLFQTAFQRHPYGLPVIGYENNVRKWSAKKISNYFQSRYSPQNMFLLITGDFEAKEAKQKIDSAFGRFKRHKIKKVTRKKESVQKKFRIKIEKSSFDQCISYLAWKVPKATHKDLPALEVLAMIMGQGDSSKLVRKLRIDSSTVISCGSHVFSSIDPGFLAISLNHKSERFQDSLNGTLEVISDILDGKVESKDLERAITNIESENDYTIETVDGISSKIGSAEFLTKDTGYPEKYVAKVKKVKIEDVIRVARKYIVLNTLNMTSLTQLDEKVATNICEKWINKFSSIVTKKRSSKIRADRLLKKVKFIAPKTQGKENFTEVIHTSSGVRVLVRPNFDTKLVSVKAAFLGGIRREVQGQSGITELMARTWMGGTKKYLEKDIYQQIESLAAGIGPVAGRNTIGLSLDSLSNRQEYLSDLYLDLMTDPQFPIEVMDRERELQLEQIKTKNDNPAQIAIRKMMSSLFGSHPYGSDMLGLPEQLQNLTQSHLREHWMKHQNKQNATFVICGAINLDNWIQKIEKYTQTWKKGSTWNDKLSFEFPKKEIRNFYELKKEQTHLVTAYPGLRIQDQDRYALHLIQSILAGQGGRLFLELRDKNSLAYSVSPIRMEGIEPGYFGAYIGCSPDKTDKALEMMRVEFNKLCQSKVGESELQRAKKYLVGRHDIDLQQVSSIASGILYDDIYGINYDESFQFAQRYDSVTPDDIMKLAQRIFGQSPVVSVVGPSDLKK